MALTELVQVTVLRSHPSLLPDRLRRAGLRVTTTRYRVVAAGLDHRNRLIGIATNTPRLTLRGYHAEERLIHRCPRSLRKIVIVRVGADGGFLPIDPCRHCEKIASERGIRIERLEA